MVGTPIVSSVAAKVALGVPAGSPSAACADQEPSAATLGSYRVSDTGSQNAPISEWNLIRDFKRYIQTTARCTFRIYGTRYEDGLAADDDRTIGYIHRWTPVYRSAVIAKFYLLEQYCKAHPTRYTMMTLTTAQDGDYSVSLRGGVTTIEESFKLLKEGFRGLTKWIRKHHPGLEYVWMLEPHKTGYPHMHVIFLGHIPEPSQAAIKALWSEKYIIGSYDNGVKFTTPPIQSIRNYLVKYIRKTLHGGKTGSKYEASTDGWTKGELLFNAVMWHNGYRLWGASAPLSRVMARPDAPQTDGSEWVFEFTELIDENQEPHVVRLADGYTIPPTRRQELT